MASRYRFVRGVLSEYLITLIACTVVAVVIVLLSMPIDTSRVIRVLIISYIYGLSIHFSVSYSGGKFTDKGTKIKIMVPALAGFVVATLLTVMIFTWFVNLTDKKYSTFIYQVLLYALIATIIIMYFFIINEKKTLTQSLLNTAKLVQRKNEKDLVISELKLLQSQIEPHFLFNTLANIKALININPDQSEIMLDNLSALLRTSLKQTRDGSTTLASEIEFCRSYLAIQQVRLSDRLSVETVVNEDVDIQQSYPPFLLLPIVENAVLHGIEPTSRSCLLKIAVRNVDGCVEVAVIDDGVGLGNSSHFGHDIGLSSIRDRIGSLFGRMASLEVFDNPSGGVTSVLRIPSKN